MQPPEFTKKAVVAGLLGVCECSPNAGWDPPPPTRASSTARDWWPARAICGVAVAGYAFLYGRPAGLGLAMAPSTAVLVGLLAVTGLLALLYLRSARAR